MKEWQEKVVTWCYTPSWGLQNEGLFRVVVQLVQGMKAMVSLCVGKGTGLGPICSEFLGAMTCEHQCYIGRL